MQWTWTWANFRRWWGTGGGVGWGAWCAAVHGVLRSQTSLGDWTTTTKFIYFVCIFIFLIFFNFYFYFILLYNIVTYGNESWTIKKAEGWSLCLWTMVLEKTLESLGQQPDQTSQSWVKSTLIVRTDADPKAPLLCQPDANILEKTLMRGKIEGRRRRGQQRMRWLDGITDEMDMNFGKP